MSIRFDVTSYDERVTLARDGSSRQTRDELVAALDRNGRRTGRDVWLSLAHRYGVIHATADVIVVLPNGDILLQERRSRTPDGRPVYALSAGGHVSTSATPESTACVELQEEVGVTLGDTARLVPICDTKHGWPLTFFEAQYGNEGEAVVVFRTDRHGHLAVDSGLGDPESRKGEADGQITCRWMPPATLGGRPLRRWTFNQEFDHFYLLHITAAEAETIRPDPEEVRSVIAVGEDQFVAVVRDGLLAPDTTHCLANHGALERIHALLRGPRE